MAECYCKHDGVIELALINIVIDTEEQGKCEEKTSEVFTAKIRRKQGESGPFLSQGHEEGRTKTFESV